MILNVAPAPAALWRRCRGSQQDRGEQLVIHTRRKPRWLVSWTKNVLLVEFLTRSRHEQCTHRSPSRTRLVRRFEVGRLWWDTNLYVSPCPALNRGVPKRHNLGQMIGCSPADRKLMMLRTKFGASRPVNAEFRADMKRLSDMRLELSFTFRCGS